MNFQYYKDNVGIDGTSYISIAVLLYVVNVILLIMFVLVYIFTILVMRNFQQDLKSTINPPFYTCYKRLHDKFKPHNQITV
jgi:positive regulator of sigma E activity